MFRLHGMSTIEVSSTRSQHSGLRTSPFLTPSVAILLDAGAAKPWQHPYTSSTPREAITNSGLWLTIPLRRRQSCPFRGYSADAKTRCCKVLAALIDTHEKGGRTLVWAGPGAAPSPKGAVRVLGIHTELLIQIKHLSSWAASRRLHARQAARRFRPPPTQLWPLPARPRRLTSRIPEAKAGLPPLQLRVTS